MKARDESGGRMLLSDNRRWGGYAATDKNFGVWERGLELELSLYKRM
jgi:hypothetical protein